ncbi:MAG TPA: ATP-binding protein [Gemmatimonadaceae bacterium]|nr:ATP-binding protein [Gemmatimonadaceae bacterium]
MSPLIPNDPPNIANGARRPDDHARPSISRELRNGDHSSQVPVGLTKVHRVIETMSRAPSLTAALDALVVGLLDTLGADAAGVMLIEETAEGRMLVTRAARGGSSLAAGVARASVRQGLLGRLIEASETIVAADVHELGDLPAVLHLGRTASFIGTPITDEGRVIGVLHASSVLPHRFGAHETDLIEVIAAGAGSTISRAGLADALQLYRRQLETQTTELEATASELELTVQALRRANAELAATAESARAAQVAAEAANRAKSAFLATMSHELRTPLNAILGYASLLLDGLAGPLAPPQRDFVERTRVSGRHLLGLVEEVLDIAKVEAGQMRVDLGPVSAARVITAAVSLVRPQAASAGVDVDASGCANGLGEVTGDERRVRQILLNLLANAVKFTRPGGRIIVRCERIEGTAPFASGQLGSWMSLSVSDTGIGIEPEHLETIFEPFVQLDASHTRARGGTGLGLAISRRFARLMGGDITVSSRMGQGASFTLWLPAWERDRPAVTRSSPPGIERSVPRLPLTAQRFAGTRSARVALGELLVATAPDIVATVVDRLRGDPQIGRARQVTRTELEDHIATYLSDIGQTFAILDERTSERGPLIKDGTAIQRLISERHGAQRHRLGWTEEELRREHEMLLAEVERVVLDSSLLTGSPPSDTLPLLRVLLHEATEVSVRGYVEAMKNETPAGIPAIPTEAE